MDISTITPGLLASTNQQSLLSSLLGTPAATPTDPMTVILQGEQQMMAVSTLGKAASQANTAAMASGDPNVIAGLQQTMQTLYTQPLNAGSFTVLQTANKLAMQDPNTFNDVFKTVNTLSGQGMSSAIQPYLAAVDAANTQSGLSAVTALNTAVAGALGSGQDTATTLKTLASLFQQSSSSTQPAGAAGNAADEIMAQDPYYFPATGNANLAG